MVKQVKPVEQAVAEVLEQVQQNLHITFDLQHQLEAKAAMKARGLEIRENFDGPIFKDIAGYQINSNWVAVSLRDGTTYAYPAAHVVRIKHYNTKAGE